MKIQDKGLILFLVSAGIFTLAQARQYVGALSVNDKKELISVSKASDGQILLCSGVWDEEEIKKAS